MDDQLTREERIRLEALNQSVSSKAVFGGSTFEIIARAKEFETYIRGVE